MSTFVVVNVMRGKIIGVRLMAHDFQAAEEARCLIEADGFDRTKYDVQVFEMVRGIGRPLLSATDVGAILEANDAGR